ncbi:MAG TPA: dTDP-4-dehydrorhamnose reductase [Bacilli bacterium]
MSVLITGGKGQLGMDAAEVFAATHEVIACGRDELDITDRQAVAALFAAIKPEIVIHCAAYTAVDKAEEDEDGAYLVNAIGTQNVALAAQKVGAKLCCISTDYVFDGTSDHPYAEQDSPNPINVYGKTKLAGERLAAASCAKLFTVRTSWVYGRHGNNFVKTMLRLAETQKPLSVVDDQIGSPTYTKDLAVFLAALTATERYGVYHVTNSGACSWYEFACAIFAESGLKVDVRPCKTADFPRPARRPRFSVLAHREIRRRGFNDLRHWRTALREFLHG